MEVEESAEQSVSGQTVRSKITLLNSPEGRLLLSGIILTLAFAFWMGIKVLSSPEEFQVLIGITATGIVFGRAACMAFGYSLDLGHSMVITICVIVETMSVLLLYPLFVFSWRHLLIVRPLKRMFGRLHQAAETHRDKVQRYGAIGLFVFVWFPFWLTGPLVGSVIGFLLGLPLWLNMLVVLGSNCVAILGWAFLLHRVHEHVASYSSRAEIVLLIVLLVIIAAGYVIHRTFPQNQNRD